MPKGKSTKLYGPLKVGGKMNGSPANVPGPKSPADPMGHLSGKK